MKPRSTRSDSATAAIHAASNVTKGLPAIPEHVRLRPVDLPFWRGVLRSRALDEWTEADLVVAAQLARVQSDIEHEARLLDEEGTVAAGKVNPRASVLEAMIRREQALLRSLRMGGRVAGDPRALAGRRKLERQAHAIRDELLAEGDDGLLA